jgi:hypothetical protein
MTSYQVLLNKLETFFNAHLQVKKFGGEFREQMPNFSTIDERYPLVYVVPTSEISGMNTNIFTLEVYCVDIIQKDRANINTILSDCQLILNDLYLYYTEGTDLSVTVITDPSMTPLNNFDLDYVAGWVGTFTFEVDQYSVCAIPLEPITPVTNECPPSQYLVEYENGTDIQEGTIPSGQSLTITVPDPAVCEDATYEILDSLNNTLYSGTILSGDNLTQVITDSFVSNSNDTYTAYILAQGSLELPDVTFSINNTLGTQVLSSQVPSVTNQTLIAPNGIVHLKKENDGTITNVTTPSGATTLYTVANNDITVNQAFPFEIHATDPLNIRVHNPQGADITPQSVVYQGNSNHVTITINPSSFVPVGATLMKTGQTTSYRTGDDGDLESGRATSFTVLASNNPFGNTNRFTDELGGQTYTKNIVIDWSTYNGTNVLGYYRLVNASDVTWNTAIDSALALSITGFTTGWRLPNKREMENICNYQLTSLLNYSPFNLNNVIWTSTTYLASTTLAYTLAQSWVNLSGKSGAGGRWMACRTFSVNGTTLT